MSANIRSALLALALGSTLAVAGTSATAQVLVFGEGPLNGGSVGAVRLRNLGNAGSGDIYLGVPNFGTDPTRRIETNPANIWENNQSHAFTFEYNPGDDTLTASLTAPSTNVTTTLIYTNFFANVANFRGTVDGQTGLVNGPWNAMQIGLQNRQSPDHTLEFRDVLFNGSTLGTGTFADASAAPNPETESLWQVRNYDFRQGFTLTGNVFLGGPTPWSTSQEQNVINISFGYDSRSVLIPLPPAGMAGAATLLGLGGLSAFRRRRIG